MSATEEAITANLCASCGEKFLTSPCRREVVSVGTLLAPIPPRMSVRHFLPIQTASLDAKF